MVGQCDGKAQIPDYRAEPTAGQECSPGIVTSQLNKLYFLEAIDWDFLLQQYLNSHKYYVLFVWGSFGFK